MQSWADTGGKDRYGQPIAHAFVWENGKMRDLGTLGGLSSRAARINDRGQVIGSADTDAKDKYGNPISHAFVWRTGAMTDLGFSEVVDINERGQVVGNAGGRGLLWQDGKQTALGGLTRTGTSSPYAINERGQVVGLPEPRSYGHVAVLWTYKP